MSDPFSLHPAGKTSKHPLHLPQGGPLLDLQAMPSADDPLDIFIRKPSASLDGCPSMGLDWRF